MARSCEEFEEVIGAEKVTVDMDKLREGAKRGVPNEIRGEVWKYLLSVSKPDKSDEYSSARQRADEYNAIDKSKNAELRRKIKQEMGIYSRSGASTKEVETAEKVQNVLNAFMNSNPHITYQAGYVHLLGPLVYGLDSESDIYFCFQRVISRQDKLFTPEGMNTALAHFMKLFRSTLSELYNYFEEEELEPNEWAMSWLQFLLARELPVECVARLWDSYFASRVTYYSEVGFEEYTGYDLHIYVCLAILEHVHEELMELEHPELKAFLQNLPSLDMDEIIWQAKNIRDEVLARDLM